MTKCLTETLLTSKSTFNNLHEVPKLKLMRAELVAETQTADALLSDALHSLGMAKGSLSTAKLAAGMKQPTVRVSNSAAHTLERGIHAFPLDESTVAFESADATRYTIGLESTRSLVDSSLEADVKFNRGIHEYYLGKVHVQLIFTFNAASTRKTRARELVLRAKSLPVRLVRRVV